MSEDIQAVIRKADLLLKEGKYKSAWDSLYPYRADPEVRKRLTWLKQQQQQLSAEKAAPAAASGGRSRLYLVAALIVILVVVGFVVFRLTQPNTAAPSATLEGTPLAAAPTAPAEGATAAPTVELSPTPTDIPPTENGQEVSLQQKLRDWLGTVEGVSKVLSFDVDVPGDEPPLGYVEVMIQSGSNDTRIPGLIVEKLKTELNTTQFSDLTVILSDGSTTTEYDYDSKAGSWNQTELSSTPKAAD